jgi:hypothetical protein
MKYHLQWICVRNLEIVTCMDTLVRVVTERTIHALPALLRVSIGLIAVWQMMSRVCKTSNFGIAAGMQTTMAAFQANVGSATIRVSRVGAAALDPIIFVPKRGLMGVVAITLREDRVYE